MLTGAFAHQIRVPQLRQALQDWTAGTPLRCVCVESSADRLVALYDDVTRYFGIAASSVFADELPAPGAEGEAGTARLPLALREADLILTTPFLLPALRPIASRLGKPLVVASLHPTVADAVQRRLEAGRVTVVCADARFADEMRHLGGAAYRDRFHVVLAEDSAAVAALDPAEPVLLTRAAQPLLGRSGPASAGPPLAVLLGRHRPASQRGSHPAQPARAAARMIHV